MNISMQTLEVNNGTAEKIEIMDTAKNELANVSFTGALGDVNFDNKVEFEVTINIFLIRNGTAELHTLLSNGQCNETAIGRVVNDRLPKFYTFQSATIFCSQLKQCSSFSLQSY